MLDQITESRLDLPPHLVRQQPVWPLPALDGRPPSPTCTPHRSRPVAELAYARRTPDDMVAKHPPGTRNGSLTHFMPDLVPVFAVRDGVIAYAGRTAHAYAIILDHRDGWASYYSDLEHMFAIPSARIPRKTERVRAGDVLGYAGTSGDSAMKCLRFELWKRDHQSRFIPIDPIDHMRSWHVLPWTDERLVPTSSNIGAAA